MMGMRTQIYMRWWGGWIQAFTTSAETNTVFNIRWSRFDSCSNIRSCVILTVLSQLNEHNSILKQGNVYPTFKFSNYMF